MIYRLIPAALVLLLFGLAGLLLAAAIEEGKQWDAFKLAHDCKIVGKIAGSMQFGNAIGADGKTMFTTSSTPDKTGWLCNDGVTYWR